MNKQLSIAFALLIIGFFSCTSEKKELGYTINGQAKGIADSTFIKLKADNKILDSTMILKESFTFKGQIDAPKKVYVIIDSSRDFSSFWLENTIIDFSAKTGEFADAQINGSDLQKTYDVLKERLEPFRKAQDSLSTLLFNDSLSLDYRKTVFEVYENSRNEEANKQQEFIKEYPNSLVSIDILNISKTTWGKDIVADLYSSISDSLKDHKDVLAVKRYIDLSKNLKIGDTFVDFSQTTPDGKNVKASDIKSKVTLIEFWASWCGPCRATNPSLVKTYKEFKPLGFEILGVSLDQDRDAWIKAINEDKLTWTNVSDLLGDENEAALIYNVSGIPDNILIDDKGIIIARDLRGEQVRKKLEEVLN